MDVNASLRGDLGRYSPYTRYETVTNSERLTNVID